MGNKTFDFSSKKKDFLPKKDLIWPKIGIFGQFGPGHAGLFGALLVGRLVVVSRKTPIYFIIRIPGEKMLGEQSDIWLWNDVF